MSYAADNPVFCAMKDEGCTASHPSGRWGNQKAVNEGWFASKAEEVSYCPEHVPDWVPAWRAKQAARKFAVAGKLGACPSVLHCAGDDLDDQTGPDPDEAAVKALRRRAFEHGRETGHAVTVTSGLTLTVEPVS